MKFNADKPVRRVGVRPGSAFRTTDALRRSSFGPVALRVILVFLLAASSLVFAPRAHAASASGPIIGIASKCLDNSGARALDGNPVQLYTCNGGAAQNWTLPGDGTIRNQGYCLDVKRSGNTPETPVWLYHCNGTAAQQWVPRADGSITNPIANLCLDDKHSGAGDGNPVWMYTCNGTAAQKWKVPSTVTPPPPPTDATPPTTPANVTAAAASATRVNLGWSASTDNVGVAKYLVYRDGVTIAATTATTYADASVAANTRYVYQVRAVDAANNMSGLSNLAGVTTPLAPDTAAPSTPGGVTASATTASRVDLRWTASTDNVGVAKYRIYRNGVSTPLAESTGTGFADTSVAASTRYAYQVAAVDAANNASALSAQAVATTPAAPDTVAPTVPGGLTAQASSATRIDLRWTASTDNVGVAKYRIYRNGSSTTLAEPTGTAYPDTSVAGGLTYSYQVRAVDAAGNVSGASTAAQATTPSVAPADVSIDFTAPIRATSNLSIGSAVSTYGDGGTNLIKGNNALWRQYLKDLGPLAWRIPLYYHGGQVGSAAGGDGRGGNQGEAYITAIKAIGGTPIVAVGGSTNDNDIQAADAAGLVHYFNDGGGSHGGPVDRFIVGNEPDNGFGVNNYIFGGNGSSGFHAIVSAMRAASTQRLYIAGPAFTSWADYKFQEFRTFFANEAADTDVVDFHKYGDGERYDNVQRTPLYADAVNWLRNEINVSFGARAAEIGIQLGEFNYNTTYAGWADTFYTSRNLVHTASLIGHVLKAGGRAYQYSDNNGPLGLITDGTGNNGQPAGQFVRLPVYWGLSAWTGGAWTRRFGTTMVAATTNVPDLEVFATDNAKKIVLVNKSAGTDRSLTLQFIGKDSGVHSVWLYRRGMDATAFANGPQFQPPARMVDAQSFSGARISVDVPWMSVVVLTLD